MSIESWVSKYSYPLKAQDTYTYSYKVSDYRLLSKADKKVLVNDFKEFYKYCFWWMNLPSPTLDQLFMASHLSYNALYNTDPSMLQAQRGLSKSLTTSLLVDWLLLRNKNEKIVVVSATTGRAESFTLFCLNLMKVVPLLQHLYPTSDQRSSGGKFDVAGRIVDDSPSVKAFGVTSAKTGSRASFLIYDDVEIPENSATAQMREKLLAGVRDTANLGISGVFRELCICTPQSSESVYNIMVDQDGFKRVILPSEYPEDISVYDGSLAPHIERICKMNPELIGTNTDKRQDMPHLMKQKMKGKSRYKLQYMLDTALSDEEKYPLKLRDLIVMDLDSSTAPIYIEYSSEKRHCLYDIQHSGFRGDNLYQPRFYSSDKREKYEGIAMFIDPSGRGEDETSYCVTATLGGRIFILDFGGLTGGYEMVTLRQLAEIAKLYKVNIIQVESNFGDGSFAELLKPVVTRIYKTATRGKHGDKNTSGVLIEDIRATKQKELRIIETLEPIMNQHRLIVSKSAIVRDTEKSKGSEYKLTHQMTHVTKDKGSLKHDDIIDVIEMGVKYWIESVARDEGEEQKRFEEEALDKELEDFMSDMCDVKKSNNVMNNY